MDSFFGIGLPELVFILLLSGIVMGPHRIRQVAHTLGRTIAQLQSVSRQFARQLNAELDAIDDNTVRNSLSDMRELQREVQELRRELSNVPKSLRNQGQDLLDETNTSLKQTSAATAVEAGLAPTEPVSDPVPIPSSTLPNAIEVPGDPD